MAARPIQIPMKCLHYTPNTNMNLTCKNEKRCIIYYEAICKEYFEKPKVLYWRCKNCGQVLTNEQYEYMNLTVCPKCKEDKVFPVIEKKGK